MVPYATTAAAQVIELVQAFGDVTVDKRQSATWYDCGRQCGPVLGDGEASGSKCLEVLYPEWEPLIIFMWRLACRKRMVSVYFMKHYLEEYNAPDIL